MPGYHNNVPCHVIVGGSLEQTDTQVLINGQTPIGGGSEATQRLRADAEGRVAPRVQSRRGAQKCASKGM